MFKRIFTIFILLSAIFIMQLKAGISGILDIEKFCYAVYNLYKTDEVQPKKELLVYKKINELIGTTQTMNITCSDSITYDKKLDNSTVKSKEIYSSDATTGYFGVFVIAVKKGDDLLMNLTPDKETSITGKITDIIVIEYVKNNVDQKCYTPLKDFDDKGTIIQKVIFKVEV
jgi:hypothetical protein